MKRPCLLILCMSMFFACTKETGEKGYTFTAAYKNSLNTAVEMQFGYAKEISGEERVIEYNPEKIMIEAGKRYEKSEFRCTKNCEPVNLIDVIEPVAVKIKIGAKEKIDTLCASFFAGDNDNRIRCEKDIISFYNNNRWQHVQDEAGNVIRREYVIDADDLAEAK